MCASKNRGILQDKYQVTLILMGTGSVILKKRGVDMRAEYTSGNSNGITGLSEDTLSDGSKDRMVFFSFFFAQEEFMSHIRKK